MVKKRNKVNSLAESISTDRKKIEETTTTPISLKDLALPVEASKENRVNLKKKLVIVEMTKLNTILIISTRKHFKIKVKQNKWKGKLVPSKEIEGDTALSNLAMQKRLEVIKMKLKTKMSLTSKRKKISIEMKNLILKMSKEEPENIELEKIVKIGKVNLKTNQTNFSDAMSILNGEKTGALGLELKLLEMKVVIEIAIKIMKVIKMKNLIEDKFTDLENNQEVKKMMIKKKIMTMILLRDKSLTLKQVNH
jgi:hypothetical protein